MLRTKVKESGGAAVGEWSCGIAGAASAPLSPALAGVSSSAMLLLSLCFVFVAVWAPFMKLPDESGMLWISPYHVSSLTVLHKSFTSHSVFFFFFYEKRYIRAEWVLLLYLYTMCHCVERQFLISRYAIPSWRTRQYLEITIVYFFFSPVFSYNKKRYIELR